VTKTIRVLIAKMGLDAHDRGARFIVSALKGAGMEVIYLGLFQTPTSVVRAAVDEAVDLIGISSLSGEYRTYVPQLMQALHQAGAREIPVIVGGLVLGDEARRLEGLGVKGIYGPSTTIDQLVSDIRLLLENTGGRQPARAAAAAQ
jgi:methylmalonyl-CoA mutase C-terminal domain/subunit